MERGSTKHGARADDALSEEVDGTLPPAGSNREDWKEPEPMDDDEVVPPADPSAGGEPRSAEPPR
jgi:hypothetical protein